MHVCVVLRDEVVHESLVQDIRACGHEVASAYNPTAALHRLGTEVFDVLVIGLSAANLNGASVIPWIRKLYPNLSIIVIATAAELVAPASGPRLHDLGVDEVLVGPTCRLQIEEALRRTRERPQENRAPSRTASN